MTALAIISATAASYVLGWLIGMPALVPVLNTAASFPFMVAALKRGDLPAAVVRMLVWALALAVCATMLSYVQPWRTETLFLRGASYRAEMFAWVMTGRGAESDPSRFIPQQLAHAAVFTVLALATGGILAMPMGAVLMNWMGHYVGALAAASAHPVLTLLLAWHPWAVIRIASYVTLGVICSAPVLSRAAGFRVEWRLAKRLIGWAVAGLAVDIVMKWLLAPPWQRILLRSVGW